MGIPVILAGQCFVDAVVKVLVMGEYNVAANIEELQNCKVWILDGG